nr:MAG TPA: hypothetical protein [Bacteriophage sp.]
MIYPQNNLSNLAQDGTPSLPCKYTVNIPIKLIIRF